MRPSGRGLRLDGSDSSLMPDGCRRIGSRTSYLLQPIILAAAVRFVAQPRRVLNEGLQMMQFTAASPSIRRFLTPLLLVLLALVAPQCRAQAQPASRIAGAIDPSTHVALQGTISPRIQGALDEGRVSGNLQLNGLNLVFQPSAAQQADLKQLLIDQQTPGSSGYHQWLTPAQFAARFGMSDADLAKVKSWLATEGFSVLAVNNSHNRISFNGTAGQVESAFSTELHHYSVNGQTHLANATAIQVPSSLSGIVASLENVTDFRPKPRVRTRPGGELAPKFTSSQSGDIYVTPADLSVIYDIAPLYAAGFTGTGQRIAIAGQSEILLSDIANFRSAGGLSSNLPIPVLMPNTGDAAFSSGDETESDIDLEYAGAIAQNATVYFVYVGNNQNYDVFDALGYAVDTDLAPVISVSYGECELAYETNGVPTSQFTAQELVFEQANAQGQTIFSAAGDSGATDCDDSGTTTITSATHGLAVDYPAASQYVTGVGGLMFNDVGATSTYWSTTNTADGGSALSYVPEQVWNETTVSIENGGGLTGGGGGSSILTAKPSWQTGTGVPADGARDVPDIALDAAEYHEGYLYCSNDPETGITGSCTEGFRDANNTYLTVAGGTSFGAPISAGILTLINQKTGSQGQGNINPSLYSIAASTPAAFHDVTVGNNSQPCTIGTTDCTSSPIGYDAGVGYDRASGLGSLDVSVLAGAIPTATTSSLIATTTALSPTNPTVTVGVTSETITATVTGNSGTGTPTGTVQFAVDGTNSGSPVALTGSVATFSVPAATLSVTGSHVISANYSGDTTYAKSYAVDTITVNPAVSTGTGAITVTGTTATAPLGGTGTSTITVTPGGGYTGSVAFTLSTTSTIVQDDSCYDISNVNVTSATPVTTTLTFYTSTSLCNGTTSPSGRPLHHFTGGAMKSVAANHPGGRKPGLPGLPIGAAAFAGAICLLSARRRSRLWMVAGVVLLSGAAFSSIGCGGSSGTPIVTTSEVPAGSYPIVVTGTDTTYASIYSSTTVTLTVQ